MPTPQDDLFLGPALASQWSFTETTPSGTPPGYSFVSNPGNITIDVTDLAELLQDVIWADYFIELGITQDNVISADRFVGLKIQSGVVGTYLEFTKYFDTGTSLPRLRARKYIGGVPTVLNDIAFADGSDIVLRIKKYGGLFRFYYKLATDAEFTEAPVTLAVTGSYSTAAGNKVGAVAVGDNTPNYPVLFSHFYFRELSDIVVNGDVVLRVTERIVVNGDVLLNVAVFPPTRHFVARQYADQRLVQLDWENPTTQGATKITLESPAGNVFDVSVEEDGAFSTIPSVDAPMVNPIVQASNGAFYTISVDDDGVLIANPAPSATFEDSILLLITPVATQFKLYVIVSAYGSFIATILSPFTYLGTTVVRNANRVPRNVSDGTAILTQTQLLTHLDGPLVGLSRYHYAAFAVYSLKTTISSNDATMPVFDNLYKNTTRRRFSKVFLSGPWAAIYAFARAIQTLVDVDIPRGLAQFNLQTATGVFANLWGQMFGSRRYPNETDPKYTARILDRVLLPRTISSTIISQVKKVPGVYFCDILDASDASMFVGHSYIGFSGSVGFETEGDSITFAPGENPFYFTVRVKILQDTDLALIIQAINDNKEAGTRFSVQILEQI